MERLSYAFADGISIARRNVIKVIRVPQILVAVLVTPIIMVLMFAYVCSADPSTFQGAPTRSSSWQARSR